MLVLIRSIVIHNLFENLLAVDQSQKELYGKRAKREVKMQGEDFVVMMAMTMAPMLQERQNMEVK